MIKVMIVDDEYLIRIGLKSTIQWEEMGFEVVCDAENGEQAMEMYETYKPDIVLTDIKMPRMDGLELTSSLRKISPQIKIVILSSYNDFGFVKEAMKLGASDYILKASMEPSEILKTLNDIKDQIHKEDKENKKLDLLRDELKEHKKHSKKKILKDFLNEELSAENLSEYEINFKYSDYVVICGRIDHLDSHYKNVDTQTKSLLRESILNIFSSKMCESYKGEVFEYLDGVFICILSVNLTKYSCEDAGYLYSTAVQAALKSYTRVTVTFSISHSIRGLNNVPAIAKETLEALQ
ncbi:MAG: response regulator, partial [Vallitaleaceae bacterium]|nr:response regulator [Vallitaleaceae bacterium]